MFNMFLFFSVFNMFLFFSVFSFRIIEIRIK